MGELLVGLLTVAAWVFIALLLWGLAQQFLWDALKSSDWLDDFRKDRTYTLLRLAGWAIFWWMGVGAVFDVGRTEGPYEALFAVFGLWMVYIVTFKEKS